MSTQEILEYKRHSLAHLLAAAVLKLHPEAKPTLGPAVNNGFYYDFELKTPLSDKDLPKIEKEMKKILKSWKSFEGKEISKKEAEEKFAHNPYKLELIKEISEKNEKITLYTSGHFTDLCRGGHIENPAQDINEDSFKLSHTAGAYWRGDEKNTMLTRIYGLAFESKEELEKYIWTQEEAKKRDHKKLGKELGLFAFSPLVGNGLPLFLPKGNIIKTELERFIRKEKEFLGYSFVTVPHIAKTALYEKSGHLGKYDAMMPTMKDKHGEEFVMKAMNCPHHFEIFNAEPKSYRNLPLRIAENTAVYRNEKSGELSGLTRVISLTQDDTHHFVTEEQIKSEIEMILGLMKKVYNIFDFKDYKVRISARDSKNKQNYFGDDTLWQKAENILIESTKKWGVPYEIVEGEAAFYGPKIDITVQDVLGRNWQLTTVQLDFVQPENFDMTYTGEDGKKHRPAVLHVAIFGSIERFMGILIEHYAGAFPLWLSPVQIKILPISSDKHLDFSHEIAETLKKEGFRVELDDTNESLGKKIRNAKIEKTPYIIVIGDKEVEMKGGTLESRVDGNLGQKTISEIVELLTKEVSEKK